MLALRLTLMLALLVPSLWSQAGRTKGAREKTRHPRKSTSKKVSK